MKIERNELINFTGVSWTATYIYAAARAVNTILEFGRTVGSTIRRAINRNFC